MTDQVSLSGGPAGPAERAIEDFVRHGRCPARCQSAFGSRRLLLCPGPRRWLDGPAEIVVERRYPRESLRGRSE